MGVSYPGPARPDKEVPLLLPPPKTKGSIKNRSRRSEESMSNLSDSGRRSAGANDSENVDTPVVKSIPDITLSQLLTLGIDDLASKLNVPSSKLNTMTIVELTKYLSDYIEKSSQTNVFNATDPSNVPVSAVIPSKSEMMSSSSASGTAPPLEKASESSAVFKVSFDDSNDATFIAKFDDNFGIDNDFIPNFDQFNETHGTSSIDKYAVFREIIDQELHSDGTTKPESKPSDESNEISSEAESPINELENPPLSSKINTKITEAISQAKDRYAALRDIILVEDLFEKPSTIETPAEERTENVDESLNDDTGKEYDVAEQSSPDANISINLEDHDELDPLKTNTTPTISQPILSSKDDLEIDEYMNRAISNLSLDSRDHLSPLSKSISKSQNASTSPLSLQYKKSSPIADIDEEAGDDESIARKTTLNDMSTSPIPIQITSTITSIMKTGTTESFSAPKSPVSMLNDDSQSNRAIISTTSPMSKNESSRDGNANNGNEIGLLFSGFIVAFV